MELENAFCPNKDCKDYGILNQGNVSTRGRYGKDKDKQLLYCKTCGTRFSASKAIEEAREFLRDLVSRTENKPLFV